VEGKREGVDSLRCRAGPTALTCPLNTAGFIARPAGPSGRPAPLPPYFLGIYSNPGNDLFNNLAVYDAATGAVVTDLASRTRGLTFTAVAATSSSTQLVAAAEPASGGRIGCGATIYHRAGPWLTSSRAMLVAC